MNTYWHNSKFDILKIKGILIIGDLGLGKTTLACKIGSKIQLPCYSTDDFYWEVKFSKIRAKEERISQIESVYSTKEWVVEGLSTHLISSGLPRADLIIHLNFKHFWPQVAALIRRSRTRKNENIFYVTQLLYKALWRRYGIWNEKNEIKEKLLSPHTEKTIVLRSFQEIDEFLNELPSLAESSTEK